jgi:hypothetical protein
MVSRAHCALFVRKLATEQAGNGIPSRRARTSEASGRLTAFLYQHCSVGSQAAGVSPSALAKAVLGLHPLTPRGLQRDWPSGKFQLHRECIDVRFWGWGSAFYSPSKIPGADQQIVAPP